MCLKALLRVAFPSDQPSPLFPLVTQCLNSGVVIYGFQVVLSADCSRASSKEISIGIFNALVNMLFASSIVLLTRRKISKGISPKESTCHLFLTDPVVIVYLLFLVWEICWLCWVYSEPKTNCGSAVLQVTLLTISICVDLILFIFTFSTEGCRRSKWRLVAADRWLEQHRECSVTVEHESELAEAYSHHNEEVYRGRNTNSALSDSIASFEHRTVSGLIEYSAGHSHTVLSSTFDRSNSIVIPSASWK